jgi:hypothetical protein
MARVGRLAALNIAAYFVGCCCLVSRLLRVTQLARRELQKD